MINAVFDQHEIAADQMKDTEENLTAWTKAIKELSELVHQCDRVLVLYDGRIAAELEGDAITEPAIMRPALGHAGEAAA